MKEEIKDFINRRFSEDCHWLDGNCYYFAMILKTRFPHLEIVYLPVRGHFMASDGEYCYDYLGAWHEDDLNEVIIPLTTIFNQDPLVYNRLVRDCMM